MAALRLLLSAAFVDAYQDRLRAYESVGDGIDVLVLTGARDAPTDGDATFFSPDEWPDAPARLMATALKAPSLRWLHTITAGVDNAAFRSLIDRGVTVTTSSGATAVPIAHAVFMHLLALTRRLPHMLDQQREHRWEAVRGQDLAGSVVAIAGMGPIGQETARLALAFGMRPIGLRRTVRGDEPCETWTLDRWHESLRAADHVVLALPLTPNTRGLLDEQAISLLRPHSLVVNIGRGDLIDEGALIAALMNRRLGGAGLDVFSTEPLPAESPLWTLPNVIVAPHSSGLVPSVYGKMVDLFFDNLGRRLRGEPFVNVGE